MQNISSYFQKLLDKLLAPGQQKFSRIRIRKEVAEDIIEFAKGAYPKEFVAALEGEIKDETLTITGLLYHPFRASETSALPDAMIPIPMTSGSIGSVHSHPSGPNTPSRQDLYSFGKTGIVHLIIKKPFRQEDMACYNLRGEPCSFEVTD